jgi:transcriptional regulator with XRE-family HTH domain
VPEPASFGTNLRHLLGMHNVSQQRLARYLGLSPQGLWNILHGRSEPRSRTAQRIAAAFGITMDALFADTGSCVRAAAGVFERAPVRGLSESNGGAATGEWDDGVSGRRALG